MTDFLSAKGYATDKGKTRLLTYQQYFPNRDFPVTLLELGVDQGGSLRMWADWFINGTIVGLDVDLGKFRGECPKRVHCYEGRQEDIGLLRAMTIAHAHEGWDIVIDDCSHKGELARISFKYLFPKLKPFGLYIIEDWGTGYMEDPAYDGARYTGENHLAGMAGFVKEMIDIMATPRIHGLPSPISWALIAPGLAIVKKS